MSSTIFIRTANSKDSDAFVMRAVIVDKAALATIWSHLMHPFLRLTSRYVNDRDRGDDLNGYQ